jgi:hypothetical protein
VCDAVCHAAIEKAPITSITISIVESHYARELLSHLIQIIDSRKLPTEENLWLRDLNKDLGANEMLRITEEVYKQG